MANARFTFCGDREPHPQHEYLDGARRQECPGIRDTPALEEIARLMVKATVPERAGSLWTRVYAAIADGDDDELEAIRSEFGDPDALHAALMEDAKRDEKPRSLRLTIAEHARRL